MAIKTKACQVCKAPFTVKRRDAKTCSAACCKKLSRGLLQQAGEKAEKLESALGQHFHHLVAELMKQHAMLELGEVGAIAAPNLAVPGLNHDRLAEIDVQPTPQAVQPEPPVPPPASDALEMKPADNSLEQPAETLAYNLAA